MLNIENPDILDVTSIPDSRRPRLATIPPAHQASQVRKLTTVAERHQLGAYSTVFCNKA
jgi:hypothetical protein